MMKKIYILILLVCFSCNIQKKAIKNKEQRQVSEITETAIKRKGDTVTYSIPNIILKDTTIYTVNRQGTTLKTVYDDRGKISQIDCFASMIEEISKSNKLLVETIKNKDKEKTEEFDSSIILYGFVGLALIIAVVAFFGFRFLNQNTTLINKIADKL